jgi:sulfate transport system ATP-binding protein
MNQGRVEQVGTAAELYDNPATPFVMSFIGPVNILPTTAAILPKTSVIEGDRLFLRPHDVVIESDVVEDAVPAKVDRVIHLGWEIQVELVLQSGQTVTAYLSREDFEKLKLERHQDVYLKPKEVKTFPSYALN